MLVPKGFPAETMETCLDLLLAVAPYIAVLSIAVYYTYSNIALPRCALIRIGVRYLETNPCTNTWEGVSLI